MRECSQNTKLCTTWYNTTETTLKNIILYLFWHAVFWMPEKISHKLGCWRFKPIRVNRHIQSHLIVWMVNWIPSLNRILRWLVLLIRVTWHIFFSLFPSFLVFGHTKFLLHAPEEAQKNLVHVSNNIGLSY